eukprot:9072889-Pyramimonas_sp.AAC.2
MAACAGQCWAVAIVHAAARIAVGSVVAVAVAVGSKSGSKSRQQRCRCGSRSPTGSPGFPAAVPAETKSAAP